MGMTIFLEKPIVYNYQDLINFIIDFDEEQI